jgi:TonB family protein
MRIAAGLVVAFGFSVLPSFSQPAPGVLRQQFRCEVPYFTGATSPQGASVKMTVVSDGLACVIANWGVPDDRRNPATSGEIIDVAQHGTAVFTPPSARYIADRDYVGPDAFAYRATVRDGEGFERVMTVHVEVDVRPAPFDRTPGVTRVSVLMPAGPIRVGNDVPAPRKIKDVRPTSPPEAQMARAQGVVVLDATIDAEGKVSNARVVRSVPLLDAAAVAAVRQWEFTPTVIDGRAVPVIMTVTVNFTVPEGSPSPSPPAAPPLQAGPSTIQPLRGGPAPKVTKRVNASYTADALRAGVQGTVVVEVTIDSQGRVSDAKVTRSIPLLDSAAVAAARQWEFTPTIIDGTPVPAIATIELSFNLAPPPAPPASDRGLAVPAPAPTSPAPTGGITVDADVDAAMQQLQRRQYEDALKAFRQANDRRGQSCAICYLGMARAYETLGAAKNVVESCDRALALVGGDRFLAIQARQLKAVALQDLAQGKDPKRLREAEDELRAALALDSTASYLHFNLGIVLLREGRDADGVAELKEELAIRPNSPQAERARSMIENPRRARESFAPNFSVVTLDREFVELSSLKGKVVLLDFWGTWCPPCVAAVPTLRDLQKKHAKDAFVLLGVSSDNEEAVVRNFTEQNRLIWPQYWDRDRKVQQAFDIRAYPTYVLIDDEGIVRFRTTGGGLREPVGLEDAIRKQLKAAAKRASTAPSPR